MITKVMAFDQAGSLLLVAVGGIATVALLRLLFNAFPGKKPPVFEGVPFVGGIIKFTKVVCRHSTSMAIPVSKHPLPTSLTALDGKLIAFATQRCRTT